MDLAPGKKREAIGRLATKLLSRDPVEFNSAINASFAPNVTYRGHGLEIRGASNLKHAAWFWNTIDAGRAATFALHDIHWDEQTQTATIKTQRFVRPRIFPLFGVHVQVPVRFHLHSSDGQAFVTRFEEIWPTERVLGHFSLVQAVHEALIKTIWTFVVLTLSNVTFAAFARANSFRVQTFDAQVERAKARLPADVSRGIDNGFTEGSHLAHGYGTLVKDLIVKVAYPPVRLTEASAQFVTLLVQRAVPIALPYPYVFDEHALPPQKDTGAASFQEEQDKPLPAPAAPPKESKGDDAALNAPSQDDPTPPATVHVGPALDGSSLGKNVRIDSRIGTETDDKPAANGQAGGGESLFDQLRKEGQDPLAESARLAAAAAPGKNGQTGSSGEDEGEKDGHAPAGANGGTGAGKKKKNKKKKNGNGNGGVKNGSPPSHAAPPTFKEGLADASPHD